MDCHFTQSHLDDYCDDLLSEAHSIRIQGHLMGCSKCQQAIEKQHLYLNTLQTCKHKYPSAIDSKALLHRLTSKNHSPFHPLAACMIAATLLIFVLPISNHQHSLPLINTDDIHAAQHAHIQNVDWIIHTSTDMQSTGLSIALPEGIVLKGNEEKKQIEWTVDLKNGDNLLSLPIRLTKETHKQNINIKVTMHYQEKKKIFEFIINLKNKFRQKQEVIDKTLDAPSPHKSGV